MRKFRRFILGSVYTGLCVGTLAVGVASGQTDQASATLVAHPIEANVDVDDNALLNAGGNQNDWLLYGRTYDNQRFSPLTQIDTTNVHRLVPVAIIQTGVANSFEATPIEVNGVLYIVTAGDHVHAYNATTGEILWSYTPTLQYSNLCCGPEARGVAVAYGKVYVAELDASLVALDAKTGQLLWKTDPAKTLPPDPSSYSFTLAPQVFDGMVIVGSSGAEYPIRGFVQAYDANTGAVLWRFRTTAAPDEPGGKTWSGDSWRYGGGSVWNTPAVDPKNGLISFAVGNPNPDVWGEDRKGDNAYTDSIVAVNAKTGKLSWWYQEVPHDLWDYDACSPVVFFDAKDGHGKTVPAAAEAGKVGNIFIVNRLSGKLLRKSEPFVLESSTKFTPPSDKPVTIYPAVNGGNLWSPMAYSPLTRNLYVMGVNQAYTYTAKSVTPYVSGTPVVGQRLGGDMRVELEAKPDEAPAPSGNLSAVDANTGKIVWQYKSDLPMIGGVVATAGNLVFTGEMNGNLDALNATSGERLWHFNLGVGVDAPPITYRVNGVQYVAVAAGGLAAGGHALLMTKRGRPQFGDVVAIFALPSAQ
jgi:alcohol dehydrogenase (cytochrome c)